MLWLASSPICSGEALGVLRIPDRPSQSAVFTQRLQDAIGRSTPSALEAAEATAFLLFLLEDHCGEKKRLHGHPLVYSEK
jgi:hypothetical protein